MSHLNPDPAVIKAREYAERAIGGIDTLHLGPLDYNVTTTVDYLRTAAKLLEQFGQDQARSQVSA